MEYPIPQAAAEVEPAAGGLGEEDDEAVADVLMTLPPQAASGIGSSADV